MTGTDEKLTALGIEKMLEDYFDLIYTQNMDLFDRVFHPSAVLYSAQDGVVVARPREEYRELMRARRSPEQNGAPRDDSVLRIDVLSPEMAMAKVRLRLNDNIMVDFLNLLLVDGHWMIVAKLYHRKLSRRARQGVYRALAYGNRERLADAMLPRVRDLYGDREAARMLAFCSAKVVTELLPELAYAATHRSGLGHRHIGVIVDYVSARAADAGKDEWRELWEWLTADVHAAAGHDPAQVLSLAAQAVTLIPISALKPVAGQLTRHDPDAMCELILHSSGRGRVLMGPAVWRALRGLPDDRLERLYEACAPHERHRFLRILPPARRTAIARPLLTRPGLGPGATDLVALDALPGRERVAIARELLARPGGADIPEIAELLTARLPWSEAKPILAEAIRRPEAEERARAYPGLVTAAVGTRDPEVVGELLDLLKRLRNEQDPVRRSALHAVTTIPSLIEAGHLPALEQLAGDALQARDRSYQSVATIGTLTRTLLLRGAQTGDSAFTDTALRLTTRLAELSAPLNLTGLHHNLPRGMEHRLFAALRRRLLDDAARDSWALTLELSDGLRRRAYALTELQDLVLKAVTAHDDSTVRWAVRLALAAPATRDSHLDGLLRRDRSLIALPEVQAIIATRRTDLLDTVLGGATSGRFLSKKIRFVPGFYTGFDRWTPRQVDRYAALLDTYARSSKASVAERTDAVRRLGLLPGTFDRLRPYIRADDLTVAEAALTALGRSDEPERAIAVLAAHTGDDKARVAVSSISACAYAIPPDRLGTTLAPLLDSPKITAVKEGVRLLAVLHAPDAMTIIRARWDRPGTHRDIRRAAVFATRWLLDHEQAWQLVAEAAADPEVAGAILDLPPRQLPVPQRERFAAFLRDLAAGSDHRVAGAAMDALTRWHRWSPADTSAVLVDRFTDLSELGLWQTAMRAILSRVAAEGDPSVLLAIVDRLPDTALPGRDLPARQRLSTLLKWLTTTVRNNDAARPVAAPVIERLAADPLWHGQLIELAIAAVRWTEAEPTVAAVEALSAMASGTLTGLPAEQLAARLPRDLGGGPADLLAPDRHRSGRESPGVQRTGGRRTDRQVRFRTRLARTLARSPDEAARASGPRRPSRRERRVHDPGITGQARNLVIPGLFLTPPARAAMRRRTAGPGRRSGPCAVARGPRRRSSSPSTGRMCPAWAGRRPRAGRSPRGSPASDGARRSGLRPAPPCRSRARPSAPACGTGARTPGPASASTRNWCNRSRSRSSVLR
ncbi:hypothetical protein NS506_02456 [Nocardia seriolae]|uniref:HEAT repeat domain-containing protein n=1 Tax=Nocardia seriolae TaxID=37332 RepID=A0ABC8AQU4_9NOCA|nr:hypothetical protein NS506_02456 [Nocardia seriolae]BEK90456.1 hypothetical protein NSERKGN1266_64070 [Nocardia seriolae]GEM25504.1 hypothetical protein NS2_37430 [Nocardia seriolae NBRC 15557]